MQVFVSLIVLLCKTIFARHTSNELELKKGNLKERKRLTQNREQRTAIKCWDDCRDISSQYLISDNLRSNQPPKMDVDSDSEMPTAGPSMGKVTQNSDHDNCVFYLI